MQRLKGLLDTVIANGTVDKPPCTLSHAIKAGEHETLQPI